MKLASNIDIMWTGDKVIPKEITVASLEPITQALKRKVVIWDNEHANDYDQRRVFLGMYLLIYRNLSRIFNSFISDFFSDIFNDWLTE